MIAIIPARKGSKGLPKKNIRKLGGLPLIEHTIKAAENSKTVKKIIVTSDCSEILKIAASYDAQILNRPAELATDYATTDAVIMHVIDNLGELKDENFVLLQPTSPFRTSRHIDEAAHLYKGDTSTVVAMKESDECSFKAFQLTSENKAVPYFGINAPFSRRQDFPSLYFANGSIYIFSKNNFLKDQRIPRHDIVPYMMNKFSSLDIDTKEDLKMAEALISIRDSI